MTIVESLQATGIRRLGSPKAGFRYASAERSRVSAADRSRIEALRIPPAWRQVAISPAAGASVQAVGLDAAGRWQYLYHPRQVTRRENEKRRRLIRFIRALPKMRQTVRRDLARPGLPREKVLAGVLQILGACFLRPGSRDYADENGTYGLATLKREHVRVVSNRILFDFPGKSKKRQIRELASARLARLVRALLRYPGEVFKYRGEDGEMVDVRRRHINAYIKEVMGESFSAKDFRTWAANLLCAGALVRASSRVPEAERERRRVVAAAIREVAGHLGNTPAVCRASYVFRSVVDCYLQGRMAATVFAALGGDTFKGSGAALAKSERALVAMLARERATTRTRIAPPRSRRRSPAPAPRGRSAAA